MDEKKIKKLRINKDLVERVMEMLQDRGIRFKRTYEKDGEIIIDPKDEKKAKKFIKELNEKFK